MLPFNIPKNKLSYWQHSTELPVFDRLNKNIKTDIGIVGGGITGITAAYLLSKKGYDVTVVDAHTLLSGTTGNTTAKVTTQHGLIYDELIQHYGPEIARAYYDANDRALQFIKQTINEKGIAKAKFTPASSFLYTTESEHVKKLEKEMKAYDQLNIPGLLTRAREFDFTKKEALELKNQAHFHPLHYLAYLIKECKSQGVRFFEQTRALSIDYSKNPLIVCKGDYRINCKYVIQASHYPFFDGQQFFPMKMYADRSYALLAKTEQTVENMYINIDEPTRSFRPIDIKGENYLIIAGENHRTGVSDVPMEEHVNLLVQFTEQHFKIDSIDCVWSAQDYTTIDKIPYVGPITKEKENVLVATGFRKWGMTNGTNAALLIYDYILQKDNDLAFLFNPSRETKFDPSVKKLFSFNAKVAQQLIKGKFDRSNEELEDLQKEEAAIIMHKGDRIGVYKDDAGTIYAVDTTCTHLGCELAWNSAEKSWDCPCHGSRFNIEGHVLNGPAVRNLRQIDFKK